MSVIDSLNVQDEIRKILDAGGFLRDVERYLKENYPNISRGLSRRSVRRYCQVNGLHRFSSEKLDRNAKENVIKRAVSEVGPSYGSLTLQGYLRTKGVQVSVRTINRVLKESNPTAFETRKRDILDRTNPVPYYAPRFGYKGHIDQNEKLVRYGVVHAVLRDGYSGYIESWITLPSKNPIKLYSQFYRPVLVNTGIFYQLRVDMGKEWVLILFIQELLKGQRENQDRAAHMKTTSKRNLTIERVCPEANARVNYPIKRILVDLEERGVIDMSNEHVMFCLSWFSCEVAKVGMERFVASWNSHKIKGKAGNGIPSHRRQQTNSLSPLREWHVPIEETAVALFEAQGGKLQRQWRVGVDQLSSNKPQQKMRVRLFNLKYSFEEIFTEVVRGNPRPFKRGLKYFTKLTSALAS